MPPKKKLTETPKRYIGDRQNFQQQLLRPSYMPPLEAPFDSPSFWSSLPQYRSVAPGAAEDDGDMVKGLETTLNYDAIDRFPESDHAIVQNNPGWLNDSSINSYLQLLCKFNSTFNFLSSFAVASHDWRSWIPRWDPRQYQFIFVPRCANNHWTLYVIDVVNTTIEEMNSMKRTRMIDGPTALYRRQLKYFNFLKS